MSCNPGNINFHCISVEWNDSGFVKEVEEKPGFICYDAHREPGPFLKYILLLFSRIIELLAQQLYPPSPIGGI